MYAIIKTGGKQYRVSEGDVLNIEKLDVEAGSEVVFDEVLTVVADSDVKIGKPVVDGAKVTAKVVEHGKAETIFVFKYKAKSNYSKRQGHRQTFTTVDLFKNEQGLITGYKVSGHAGFAAAGEDIVCGAVSVLTQTPILGLEQHLKCQPSYHVDEEDGILEVNLNNTPNELTQAILATMEYGLLGVAEQYPKYVRIHTYRR